MPSYFLYLWFNILRIHAFVVLYRNQVGYLFPLLSNQNKTQINIRPIFLDLGFRVPIIHLSTTYLILLIPYYHIIGTKI